MVAFDRDPRVNPTRYFKRLARLTSLERRLFVESWIRLGVMRLALSSMSVKSLFSGLRHNETDREEFQLSESDQVRAMMVGYWVETAARFTPWKSTCLMQALVAQQLLARYGISGRFHLGVALGKTADSEKLCLTAHAWLESGNQIVSGGAGDGFTSVSTYSW